MRDGRPVVVIGAGPAGLTAGYQLAKIGVPVIVVEAEDAVGGLAKTVVDENGYRFDLGGHRFFTKNAEVNALWDEIMGGEFLLRPRMSRIHWRGRFLDYPLRASDVARKLGPYELTRSLLSYLWAAMRPKGREENLEQWVCNRFGKRLYLHFFKSYTEKVWGVPATDLRAEWAAQRIKGLSFFSAARAAMPWGPAHDIKSLVTEFQYPRYGPGQMWERMTDAIEAMGGEVRRGAPVSRIEIDPCGDVTHVHAGGEVIEPSAVISSLGLQALVKTADPPAPAPVRQAARGLRYRDFMTVAVVLDGEDLFPDNWIYVHEPQVKVGRIQNYRSWSPWMVPDPQTACVGLEYFCFRGDDLWNMSDDDLVTMATRELEQLGLASADKVRYGTVVRVPLAYPMYDEEYLERVAGIRTWLEGLGNLQQVGRNGLHRYNNSDHSMLSAMRAVENLVHGTDHDIWAVNVESSYLEETTDAEVEQPYLAPPVPPMLRDEPLPSRTAA